MRRSSISDDCSCVVFKVGDEVVLHSLMRNTGECLILSHLSPQAIRSGDETSRDRGIGRLWTLSSFLFLPSSSSLSPSSLFFFFLSSSPSCSQSAGVMISLFLLQCFYTCCGISGPNPSYSRGFEETHEQVQYGSL